MADNYVYIRKLNAQELGFRKGEPKKAGRYIYVSKEYLAYFPPLSTLIRNDHVFIAMVPPFEAHPVLTNYVYHNDKITDQKSGGRDEYRIYLNEGIDPHRDYFMPEDIVLFYKIIMENGSIAYQIYLFSSKSKNEQYKKLENILKQKGANDSHALVPLSDIPFISLDTHIDTSRVLIPEEVREAVLSEEEVQLIPEEELSKEFEFTNFIRETAFRDLLLYFYDFRCAVTGTVIRYGSLLNLEAAHIIPAELKGPAHPRNGIPLNRDMHWAFDKGLFTIDDSYIVRVHERAKDNKLLLYIDGRKIILPEDSRARPSNFSLKWHRENMFGVFLNFV